MLEIYNRRLFVDRDTTGQIRSRLSRRLGASVVMGPQRLRRRALNGRVPESCTALSSGMSDEVDDVAGLSRIFKPIISCGVRSTCGCNGHGHAVPREHKRRKKQRGSSVLGHLGHRSAGSSHLGESGGLENVAHPVAVSSRQPSAVGAKLPPLSCETFPSYARAATQPSQVESRPSSR